MGIPVWTAHRSITGQRISEQEDPELSLESSPEVLSENISNIPHAGQAEIAVEADFSSELWQSLRDDVSNCTTCDLHQSRTNRVFGVGNKQASLLVVGEAPDEEAGIKGEPFVGPAGHLLNQMLFALGFSRDEVFITNTVKCSLSDERKPTKAEIESCSAFLSQQIKLVGPKVILCIGAASAKSLLNSNETIGNLRGQVRIHEETSIPIIATYHPAYLMRKLTEKRAVWDDLLMLKKQLVGEV